MYKRFVINKDIPDKYKGNLRIKRGTVENWGGLSSRPETDDEHFKRAERLARHEVLKNIADEIV